MWLSNSRSLHAKSNNVGIAQKTFLLGEKMVAINGV